MGCDRTPLPNSENFLHLFMERSADSKVIPFLRSDDNNETLVLTYWGSKEDMDNYYSNGNSSLSSLVEEVKPMFEKMPERITYNVVSLDVTK
jgi:hypothetical protein